MMDKQEFLLILLLASCLNEITGKHWWIGRPIELPASRPLRLEYGDLGSQLATWPQEL